MIQVARRPTSDHSISTKLSRNQEVLLRREVMELLPAVSGQSRLLTNTKVLVGVRHQIAGPHRAAHSRPASFSPKYQRRGRKSHKERGGRVVARRERADSISRQHRGACRHLVHENAGPTRRPTFHLLHLDHSFKDPDESPLKGDTRELLPAVSGQSTCHQH